MPCKREPHQIQLIESAIQTANLEAEDKLNLTARFVSLLYEYRSRSTRYSYSFNTLRIIITVGSLIVPALLSVQYTAVSPCDPEKPMGADVYWTVWVLSLLVTISNGVIALLKVDKKYFVLNTIYQHLLSEGWQFVQLSGKYSGFYTPDTIPTHKNQFIFFCNMIEKIRMKQIEDEYYKVTEHHGTHASGQQDQLIPPTPAKQLPFTSSYNEKSIPLVNDSQTTVRKYNPSKKSEFAGIAGIPEISGSPEESSIAISSSTPFSGEGDGNE